MSAEDEGWDPFADILPEENEPGPRVLNLYALPGKQIPDGAIYIGRGRGGEWGNPFEIGRDGTRDEVIAKHIAWLNDHPEMIGRARRELRGRDLVCFCSPKACHGDVLIEVANA